MDLSGILQIAIPVRDIERATAFYRDVLELRMLMNGPNMAFFDCGGVRLYLSCPEGAQSGEAPAIYFRTGNIDKQLETLKRRNVSIHQQPQVIANLPGQDLWLMWFRDSEENLLAIMEERKK
jgi:catechol 2,3-dioxygenase-like lactoylglutathione lyase family enzyme